MCHIYKLFRIFYITKEVHKKSSQISNNIIRCNIRNTTDQKEEQDNSQYMIVKFQNNNYDA